MPSYVGVDGCRGGWVAAQIETGAPLKFQLFKEFAQLWSSNKNAQGILVDVPIGLKSDTTRHLEQYVRRLLGPRRSSVFPVPVRSAVFARDYASACTINEQATGKRISKQAYNICPKIREVDCLLQHEAAARLKVFESHPELCFAILKGEVLVETKHNQGGRQTRRTLLEREIPGAGAQIDAMLALTIRSQLKEDDLLDALVLAISATTARTLNTPEESGVGGIDINLRVPSPRGSLFSVDVIW